MPKPPTRQHYSAWSSLSPWNRLTVVALWLFMVFLVAAAVTDWRLQ